MQPAVPSLACSSTDSGLVEIGVLRKHPFFCPLILVHKQYQCLSERQYFPVIFIHDFSMGIDDSIPIFWDSKHSDKAHE